MLISLSWAFIQVGQTLSLVILVASSEEAKFSPFSLGCELYTSFVDVILWNDNQALYY